MQRTLRIALGQINTTLGDINLNIQKMQDYIHESQKLDVDILAFPELAITGYPPEDLLLKPQFVADSVRGIRTLARYCKNIIVVAGFVDFKADNFNAAAVIDNGQIIDVYHKIHLPNYSVFDEERYFSAGSRIPVYKAKDFLFGVNICEDIWYPYAPTYIQALNSAELIININASPFHIGKYEFKKKMLCTRANDASSFIAYVNLVGGQDELVFDGGSMVIDPQGDIISNAGRFKEHLLICDINLDDVIAKRLKDPRYRKPRFVEQSQNVTLIETDYQRKDKYKAIEDTGITIEICEEEEIFNALITGTRDYVLKNGFKKVCLGLSGGIDSAIVAVIAVEALGKDNVDCIFMPSIYTSKQSRDDVYQLAKNLGIHIIEIPISDIFDSYLKTLAPFFKDTNPDITEENIQSRIRGNILMAWSNKFGNLVLTTGNKSEMSVGYATLYGDMAGGFAVIKDVSKTNVYRICRWLNKKHQYDFIPQSILTKAPTAELKENQKDTDTLPPYDTLDKLIEAYIENDVDVHSLLNIIDDTAELRRVLRMIDKSEYKRRQAPLGIKITKRSFGRDRRYPITNKYDIFNSRDMP
ncbi:MAG: NAD+ synthase [Thermodesulfovibrionales bacterium]|nr:NAD+ synthase [Thermodesulfovibrionales bacterium]